MKIKIELLNDAVLMVISDDGVPFNPLLAVEPDTHAPLEEHPATPDTGGQSPLQADRW